MNEEINELILLYEQQSAELESQINAAVLEGEYKLAYLYQKGLREVSQELQILQSLKDPYYRKKNELGALIHNYNRMRETENGPLISEYLDEKISALSNKIAILNSYKIPPAFDSQEFDDLIFDIVEGKIKGFIFQLKKTQNLFLKFKCKKNHVVISLPPLNEIGSEIYIPKSSLKKLKAIGFSNDKGKKKYRFKYPIIDFKDANGIKMIVSRVIYNVFYPNVDNLTSLEIVC